MKELNELKMIVSQELKHYDKNEISHWGYYNAYKFVLDKIESILSGKK